MEKTKYSHVIWDWNGTLLNDVDWCIKCVNTMLAKRGIKTFATKKDYHRVFGFPIVDYYRKAGFDFETEPFSELAKEYMLLYHGGDEKNCQLFPAVKSVLEQLTNAGVRQVLLSASETNNLEKQIKTFNASGYFDTVLGTDNILAQSKEQNGIAYIQNNNVQKAVLVGDTEHDFDVARAIGADCILVASGHQSEAKLLQLGAKVVGDVSCVLPLIL